MTQDKKSAAPREFWIGDTSIGRSMNGRHELYTAVDVEPQNSDWTKFVEYSAFEALQKRCEELEAIGTDCNKVVNGLHKSNIALQARVNKLTELERYSSDLADTQLKELEALQSKLAEQAAEIERRKEVSAKRIYEAGIEMKNLYRGQIQSLTERIADLENEKSELIDFHHFGKCENKIDQLTEQNSILRGGLVKINNHTYDTQAQCSCDQLAREALASADKVKGE